MRFSGCGCWPQTSLVGSAARQCMLIMVTPVVLYFVKRRSDPVAMHPLPQIWKIHYNVRSWEWPMGLSEYLIKLRLCKLLFTQYQTTWLFRNTAMKTIVGICLNREGLFLTSEQIQSAKAMASFHNISAQFLRLRSVLILVTSIFVSRYRSLSHCLKQFCDSV